MTTIEALTSATDSDGPTYYAVQDQDYGDCEDLRWEWMSVRPYVLASGPDPATVYAEAVQRAGHEDVRVVGFDAEGKATPASWED